MTIDSYDTFKLWRAAHLHFTTPKFSIVKYGSKTAHLDKLYSKLTQMELKKFSNYGKVFNSKQEYCQAMIAAYLDGVNPRYDPIPEVKESYMQFMSRKQSMTYKLKLNYSSFLDSDKSVNWLISSWSRKEIIPEFLIMIDSIDNYIEHCYNQLEFIGYKDGLFKLQKYKELFKAESYYEKVFGTPKPTLSVNR